MQHIRIGTRKSQLALWQANYVKELLEKQGVSCELVPITSDGEKETTLPIYEIGVTGVFTRTLDIALLENKIDIAVHSLKDVPTKTPVGIHISAVPERGNHKDVIVSKSPQNWEAIDATIATSSIRRKAQWAYEYRNHSFQNIRGNINTRLQKLLENDHWHGVVFAAAGIERINLSVPYLETLDWMLPAPAQGALGIASRIDDRTTNALCSQINHEHASIATKIERQFLSELMGGCATPIAAFAEVKGQEIHFKANILSLGPNPQKKELIKTYTLGQANDIGKRAAEEILLNGGEEIIQEIRRTIG